MINISKEESMLQGSTDLLKEENKLVADVGPIKYVADIFFGTGDGALDKAVRMVIFTIMLVFDPLAVLLLIAGNISLKEKKEEPRDSGIKKFFSKAKKIAKKLDKDRIEVEKENIAAMQEDMAPKPQKTKRGFPNRKSKLEPKYDYEAELAFREKENK